MKAASQVLSQVNVWTVVGGGINRPTGDMSDMSTLFSSTSQQPYKQDKSKVHVFLMVSGAHINL